MQGARHGTGLGARAARAQGRWALGATERKAGARVAHAAGRAAGPAGCALGARNLFLARFDSVFFQSQIFRHCS